MNDQPPLPMKVKLGVAAAALAILLAAALVLLDRYRYFDYKPVTCAAGTTSVAVDLIGSFSPGTNDRTSPYYLRLSLGSDEGVVAAAEVSSLKLLDTSSSKVIEVGDLYRSIVSSEGRQLLVFTKSDMNLAYRDYQVMGEVRLAPGTKMKISNCSLIRDYSEERRLRFWDVLMSA